MRLDGQFYRLEIKRIVMGIFDIAQQAVNQSAGIIAGETSLGSAEMMALIETQLQTMEIGELLGLFLEMQKVHNI